MLKSGIADYAFEHYEIASYNMLIAAAGEAGEHQVEALCRRIGQEEEMAAWLASICRRSRVSTCIEKPRGRWQKYDRRRCEQGYGNPGEEQTIQRWTWT